MVGSLTEPASLLILRCEKWPCGSFCNNADMFAFPGGVIHSWKLSPVVLLVKLSGGACVTCVRPGFKPQPCKGWKGGWKEGRKEGRKGGREKGRHLSQQITGAQSRKSKF
jgi:hypothetical protein